jgi:predicted transcriptional regulator
MSDDRPDPPALSRRERQLLDIVYRLGRATAAEIRAELPDSPSDSSVRTLLRLMEDKGHLAHEVDGPRYVYFATMPPDVASRRALHHLIRTFFGGSPQRLVSTLLDDELLDDEALEALAQLVDDKRKEGP